MIRAHAPILLLLASVTVACASDGSRFSGPYRLDDGRLISVRPSTDDTLRSRVFDTGESRLLYPEGSRRYVSGGFSQREPVDLVVDFSLDPQGRAVALSWEPRGGDAVAGRRVPLVDRPARIRSGELTLHGRLTLPPGPGPHPAVVLVHGSGSEAATRYYFNGDFLASHGIATFVYDKRGTGESEGRYVMDFYALAGDVVAAVEWLKTQSDVDPGRIGVSGYSQGGWIGPLAASMSEDIRFVIVNYGMMDSPAEEERIETRNELRKRGVDEASLEKVDELTLAAVRIMASGFKDGWDEFDAIVERYEGESWLDQFDGTAVGAFLTYPHWVARLAGPWVAPSRLPWYYDSVYVVEHLSIPVVWIIAGADESAPPEFTIEQVRRLRDEGKPYPLIVFAGAAHGMLEFEERDGERVYTGYASDYFKTEVSWARRLTGLEPMP